MWDNSDVLDMIVLFISSSTFQLHMQPTIWYNQTKSQVNQKYT